MKRARLDDKESSLPDWLMSTGLPEEQVLKFVTWMDTHKLCFAHGDLGHQGSALDHIVSAVHLISSHGEDIVGCADCAVHCDCCGEALWDEMEAHEDTPHTTICYNCALGSDCTHTYPEQCPCCGHGAKELFLRPGGLHEDICMACEDEGCPHAGPRNAPEDSSSSEDKDGSSSE